MQSSVNWALLGLVIERPSYAYELAHRFERTYEGALSLSSSSHVYTALGTLESRDLIEEVPGTRTGRQPKPIYRATDRGVREYREWLVAQADEDSRRRRLFVIQLAALTRNPRAALETIERYQQACLEEAGRTPLGASPGRTGGSGVRDREEGGGDEEEGSSEGDPGASLRARLLAEESRLALGAKLAWIEYARQELRALGKARTRRAAQ